MPEAIPSAHKALYCSYVGLPDSLYQFLVEACALRLPGLYAANSARDEGTAEKTDPCGMLTSFSMSKKKSHEVTRLSKAIADVMTSSNLHQVNIASYVLSWIVCVIGV